MGKKQQPEEVAKWKVSREKAADPSKQSEELLHEAIIEDDIAEAKRQRKTAKRAAKDAAAAGDEAEAQPAGEEEEAAAADEAKRLRKAAKLKRAAAEMCQDQDQETPEKIKKRKGSPDTSDKRKVFVGGLAYSVDSQALREHFSACGEVADATILQNEESGKLNKSRGIGFVTFKSSSGYKAALRYDGEDLVGRKMHVSDASNFVSRPCLAKGNGKGKGNGKDNGNKLKGKERAAYFKEKAKPKEKPAGCTSVCVRRLSYDVTMQDLRNTFRRCGDGATNVKLLEDRDTGKSKGIAFVDFADTNAVDEAMELDETILKGRVFFMDYSTSKPVGDKGDGKGSSKD